MSDEYRGDREQDARRYGGRAREAYGRDRWSARNGSEPRSFEAVGPISEGRAPRAEGYGGWGYDYRRGRGYGAGGAFGGRTADPYTQRAADGDFGGWRQNITEGGQHRGKGPKGYKRSDARIQEDVCERLSQDPWLDAGAIEVAVKDGEVTLSGKVRQREDKRDAEDLAETVSGVTHVQCNLRYDPDVRG